MTAETPDSVLTARQSDRRPAIWPWLVMPLIAFTLFYCLDQLRRAHEPDHRGLVQPDIRVQAESETR